MTAHNLFITSLNDIFQVQLECNCGATFAFSPDKEIGLPLTCHQCNVRWRDDFGGTFVLSQTFGTV
jgi:hypothetical protein